MSYKPSSFCSYNNIYIYISITKICTCGGGVSMLPVWQPSPVQPGRHRQVFQRIQVPPWAQGGEHIAGTHIQTHTHIFKILKIQQWESLWITYNLYQIHRTRATRAWVASRAVTGVRGDTHAVILTCRFAHRWEQTTNRKRKTGGIRTKGLE